MHELSFCICILYLCIYKSMSGNCNFVLSKKVVSLESKFVEEFFPCSLQRVCRSWCRSYSRWHILLTLTCPSFYPMCLPGIWSWDIGDTMVAQQAHWLQRSPVLTRLPGSNRELGSWIILEEGRRGRDESIICGSRRCIATVTLHMYTSPECNTVWSVHILWSRFTQERSQFKKF